MPTIHGELTSTTDTTIYQPPKHRKMIPTLVKFVNKGTATVTVTLKAVDLGGNEDVIDEITLAAGQEVGMIPQPPIAMKALDSGVYDLDKGDKLVGVLDTAGTVKYTITYRLK